jgi:hypothetical protein
MDTRRRGVTLASDVAVSRSALAQSGIVSLVYGETGESGTSLSSSSFVQASKQVLFCGPLSLNAEHASRGNDDQAFSRELQ